MSEPGAEVISASWDRVVRESWWVTLICLWALTLMTFGAPGREGALEASGLDWIAMSKILTRGLCLLAMWITVVRLWGHPRRERIALCVLPFALYALFCILSTLWSALPMITLGQSISALSIQVLLTFLVAMLCQSEEDISRFLLHLVLVGGTVALIVLAVHVLFEDLSGLRGISFEHEKHGRGIHHPTELGGGSSMTILVTVACLRFWGWQWSRKLLLPVLVANLVVLVMAANRMGILCTVVVGGLLFLSSGSRLVVAITALGIGLALFGYMLIDPGMHAADAFMGNTSNYLTRGEDTESLQSGTGRTYMWNKIWEEFLKSPLIGHGFFVTSEKGYFYMWWNTYNYTAHNIWLHLLVTTGVFGFGLFVWGLIQAGVQTCTCIWRGESDPRLGWFLLLMVLWYLIWTIFDDTFVQSISLTSATFYVYLGIAIGQLRPRGTPIMYDFASIQARNASADPVDNGPATVPRPGRDSGFIAPKRGDR